MKVVNHLQKENLSKECHKKKTVVWSVSIVRIPMIFIKGGDKAVTKKLQLQNIWGSGTDTILHQFLEGCSVHKECCKNFGGFSPKMTVGFVIKILIHIFLLPTVFCFPCVHHLFKDVNILIKRMPENHQRREKGITANACKGLMITTSYWIATCHFKPFVDAIVCSVSQEVDG